MRIAYLAQSYPPMISGAAIMVERLAKGVVARGHEALVIAASDREQMYRAEKEKLTVVRMQSLRNPLRVRQRFLLYPRHPVMKSLQNFKPDIIHVHEPLQLGWLSIEYAKRMEIPVLLTLHQTPAIVASYLPDLLKVPASAFLWTYARWLAGRFSCVITPTQTTSRLFELMTGVPARTISSGIDLQNFHPASSSAEKIAIRQRWNLPSSEALLLHVGRLDLEKKVERLILAAASALRQTDAHLVIVGDGAQKQLLMELCKQLGIAERVHFTGFISTVEGLPELYRVGSVFLTASEVETQGIVLLEAAASGLPIVAVRASCLPEIVHEGVNGFLTEPGDIQEMASAITFLLKNPGLPERLGRASRSLVGEHSWVRTLDAHEMLYRDTVRRRYIRRVGWSAFNVKT